ncbi:hypothetical protein ACFYTQ_04625 [Nocardia sp. NPDC004068]|uniref:hypothetical protein n=1 Tax=Nocardia sp. NPDC004068 TaxID=3364303 RepID=UPI003684D678
MPGPAMVFDPGADLTEELVAVLTLVLLADGDSAARRSPRRLPNTHAHNMFRDPRGWR